MADSSGKMIQATSVVNCSGTRVAGPGCLSPQVCCFHCLPPVMMPTLMIFLPTKSEQITIILTLLIGSFLKHGCAELIYGDHENEGAPSSAQSLNLTRHLALLQLKKAYKELGKLISLFCVGTAKRWWTRSMIVSMLCLVRQNTVQCWPLCYIKGNSQVWIKIFVFLDNDPKALHFLATS